VVYQSAIDALLAQARAVLDRVEPEDLDDELAAGAVLIDIRPVEQRQRDGELTGAIIIDRNVLEWRLDPTSLDRLPLRQAPTFATSWCATRATAQASPRPHCVILV
jgi:hypothetical protein